MFYKYDVIHVNFFMPIGLLICHSDLETGVDFLAVHPENLLSLQASVFAVGDNTPHFAMMGAGRATLLDIKPIWIR